jgi:hypothetical protein
MVAGPAAHDIVGAKRTIVVTALVAGCGGGSMATAPGGAMSGGTGGGTGGGTSGGTGGDVGGGNGGGSASSAVTVTVGNDFFRSDRNSTANAAIDTIAAGGDGDLEVEQYRFGASQR